MEPDEFWQRLPKTSASKLDPLLPLTRIAAGMKTSDNQEGVGLDQKKERIGKFLRARPPESLKDDGKLPGIVGQCAARHVRFRRESGGLNRKPEPHTSLAPR